MTQQKLILIGGGGHCKSCIDVIETNQQFEIIGIIDQKEKIGQTILGYPIIGSDEDILKLKEKTDFFLITIGQIGSPKHRKELFFTLKEYKCKLATVISPLAHVSRHANIEEGSIIMHHAIVNAAASIGKNCIINTKALIEHDVSIGDHCHISTAAVANGGVNIGEESFFGSNAVSKEGVSIAKGSFIKSNIIVK